LSILELARRVHARQKAERNGHHAAVCGHPRPPIGRLPRPGTGNAVNAVNAVSTSPLFLLVRDAAGLEAVLAALADAEEIGLDCETTGLSPRADRVRLLQLSVPTIDGGYFTYVVDCFAISPSPLWEALAERTVVGHNLTFDLQFLAPLGFVPGQVRDTMLLSQLLHGTRRRKGFHGLEQTAEREIGRKLDKGHQKSDWSAPVLSQEQLSYAAADAAVLLPLLADLEKKTRPQAQAAAIEHRCLPATAWLSRCGVLLDRPAWEALARQAK
jgi:DNA polymerase-1